MTTKNHDMTSNLFCDSHTECNPPVSMIKEFDEMRHEALGWWGLGWWQAEAIKQANRAQTLQLENDHLRALLAKTEQGARG